MPANTGRTGDNRRRMMKTGNLPPRGWGYTGQKPAPSKCHAKNKIGWVCIRADHVTGPCGLIPRWWNMSKDARRYRKAMGSW